MKHLSDSQQETLRWTSRFSIAAGLCVVLALLLAVPALATFEHVATFGGSGEGAFGNFGGPAASVGVNTTGAGGVPAGTVYVATFGRARVLRYSGTGEFREAWGWGVAEPPLGGLGAEEFQRCGPEGEPAFPICGTEVRRGEGKGQFNGIKGLAVDQTTGYVYVYSYERKHGAIQVFNADGSELITSFGERTVAPSFDEEPANFHLIGFDTPIAVDEVGDVFVVDGTVAGGTGSKRVMTFTPQTPGDYEHYTYAGRASDLEITPKYGFIENVTVGHAGNLVISGERNIYEFDMGHSTAPTCTYVVPDGGAYGMTANSANGEVFYFSYKDRKIHQLSPCNAEHSFIETASFPVARKTKEISSLAFDDGMAFEASRSPGILYAFDEEIPTEAEIFAPAEARSPVIEAESASAVGSTDASLDAQINPKGSETRYAFQYLTAAAYQANEPTERFAGATEAPEGGAVLGSGQATLATQVGVAGLMPETEYKYRVIATSSCNPEHGTELCVTSGAAMSFRTYPESRAGLPDNRAYELVSPAIKGSGEVFPINGSIGTCKPLDAECKPGALSERYPRQVSPDGESVVYEGSPFSASGGAPVLDEYLSKRASTGWKTVNLTPERLGGHTPNGYKAFNLDLTEGALIQGLPTLAPTAPADYANLYMQPSGEPLSLTPLLEVVPPNRSPESNAFTVNYGGASEDFSRFFFAANDALTGATQVAPAAKDGGTSEFNLYEEAQGELRLVNVLPGNDSTEPGASFGARGQDGVSNVYRLLSTDGARVFWTSADGQVYVREGASVTREVSESQRTIADPVGAQTATFLAASHDGSRALFSSTQELTNDADTGSIEQTIGVKATAGTFTITFQGQQTTPLAFNATPPQVQTALEGLPSVGPAAIAVAEPGKAEYKVRFVGSLASNEQLLTVDGANLSGTVTVSATRSREDMYEWNDGVVTDLTNGQDAGSFEGLMGQSEDLSSVYFVDSSVLDNRPNAQGQTAEAGGNNLYLHKEGQTVFIATLGDADNSVEQGVGDWQSAPQNRTAEASANGRWAAFLSQKPLTGVDGAGRFEVFLYDAGSGQLTCPSCNPAGMEPIGASTLPIRKPSVGMANGPQQQYLTDNGRLYFDSRDSLTPFDTNNGVEDVYQYEPEGLGSCARDGGCVVLISAGTSTVDSNFLAADSTGQNVFFTTRDQLSPRDHDEQLDLYDARENGGIASESETVRSACHGEACQSPPVASNESTPGSAAFEGAGNVATSAALTVKSKPKSLTRAQGLAKALKACRGKPKKKRPACEKAARKRYGAPAKRAVANHKGGK